MSTSIIDILNKAYELEGLLLLAQSRGNEDISAISRLIVGKKAEISDLIDATFSTEVPAEPVAPAVTETMVPDAPAVQEDDPATPETPVLADYEKEDIQPVDEPIFPQEEYRPAPSFTLDDYEPVPVEVPEEDAPLDEEYVDDEDDDDDEILDEDDETLTLDEALQRSMSRDLRKAFSLNDRFRYRRELFGNSDVEMNDTLNLVETMHSFAEAEEFFYGDLEWDKESPEVKDFMAIIRNHFYNR